MIRGEKTLIDYDSLFSGKISKQSENKELFYGAQSSNPNILFFYTNNEKVDNDFYLNNYQNYYTIEYC